MYAVLLLFFQSKYRFSHIIKRKQEITRQMTREQLAEYVVSVLNDYEATGLVEPPGEQNVTDYEKKEAMFCHIRNWCES